MPSSLSQRKFKQFRIVPSQKNNSKAFLDLWIIYLILSQVCPIYINPLLTEKLYHLLKLWAGCKSHMHGNSTFSLEVPMVSSEIPAFSDDVTGDSQHTDQKVAKCVWCFALRQKKWQWTKLCIFCDWPVQGKLNTNYHAKHGYLRVDILFTRFAKKLSLWFKYPSSETWQDCNMHCRNGQLPINWCIFINAFLPSWEIE